MEKPETIKSRLHRYCFDVSKPVEADEWRALKARLKAEPGRGRIMHACSPRRADSEHCGCPAGPVELETKHLFDNQWNTAGKDGHPGFRVFDWFLDADPQFYGQGIRRGHWLEVTPAMVEVRNRTSVCGYCGAQYWQDPREFCGACIDSEHLKEHELPLTRCRPVSAGFRVTRPALTPEEAAHWLPIYRDAQIHGATERGRERIRKRRERLVSEYQRKSAELLIERDAGLWLLDHCPQQEPIYYGHRAVWQFGWREPLADVVAVSVLRELLAHAWSWWPVEFKVAGSRADGDGGIVRVSTPEHGVQVLHVANEISDTDARLLDALRELEVVQ